MLISCPLCPKSYRVPDDAIPPEGRDVSCSACGTVWFEPGAASDLLQSASPSRADFEVAAEIVDRVWQGAALDTDLAAPPEPIATVAPGPLDARLPATTHHHAQTPPQTLPVPVTAARSSFGPEDPRPAPAPAQAQRPSGGYVLRSVATSAARVFGSAVDAVKARVATDRADSNPGHAAASKMRARVRYQVSNRLTPARLAGWSAWAMSVALFAALVGERDQIAASWPRAGALYERIWAKEGPTLVLTDVVSRHALSVDGPVLEVSGLVRNGGSVSQVPAVTLAVAGHSGREVRRPVRLSDAPLSPGDSRPFVIRAALPAAAVSASLWPVGEIPKLRRKRLALDRAAPVADETPVLAAAVPRP